MFDVACSFGELLDLEGFAAYCFYGVWELVYACWVLGVEVEGITDGRWVNRVKGGVFLYRILALLFW